MEKETHNSELNPLDIAIKDQNLPEAKRLIDEAVRQKMTDVEEGETLAGIASIYLDLVNDTNEEYKNSLLDILEGLEHIRDAEAKSENGAKLAEVRASLGLNK